MRYGITTGGVVTLPEARATCSRVKNAEYLHVTVGVMLSKNSVQNLTISDLHDNTNLDIAT
jgi:hypothetical protein